MGNLADAQRVLADSRSPCQEALEKQIQVDNWFNPSTYTMGGCEQRKTHAKTNIPALCREMKPRLLHAIDSVDCTAAAQSPVPQVVANPQQVAMVEPSEFGSFDFKNVQAKNGDQIVNSIYYDSIHMFTRPVMILEPSRQVIISGPIWDNVDVLAVTKYIAHILMNLAAYESPQHLQLSTPVTTDSGETMDVRALNWPTIYEVPRSDLRVLIVAACSWANCRGIVVLQHAARIVDPGTRAWVVNMTVTFYYYNQNRGSAEEHEFTTQSTFQRAMQEVMRAYHRSRAWAHLGGGSVWSQIFNHPADQFEHTLTGTFRYGILIAAP